MVSTKTRTILWARAAGRCQYPGCNKQLIGDLLSGKVDANSAYAAHIVAETPGGPRGDEIRSPLLADDPSNLMLLCDTHHRVIDRDAVDDHPEAVLLTMKARHEDRIEAVTSIGEDRQSHMLLFGARVGEHDYPVRYDLAAAAMLPERYPAERQPIQLDLARLAFDDGETEYWNLQIANLRRQFDAKVLDRLRSGHIGHLSLFALAPQPLLIELGRLISDIAGVTVHQLHREPQDWRWRTDRAPLAYVAREGAGGGKHVALKLSLSATITDERITSVLGADVPIWELAVPAPHNDIMHRADDLSAFRRVLRGILDRIKARHGQDAVLHVFPAVPVSAAVEIGRVWMPKADLPLIIYDQGRESGFRPRVALGTNLPASPVEEAAHV
jgi:hypothetical protein